jgi:hypothetical protein
LGNVCLSIALGSETNATQCKSRFCGTWVGQNYTCQTIANLYRIFTPKSIAGLGKFQDGGLKHNNPLRLGLKEIRVLYPNDPSAKRSALKVSLGTGKAVDNDSGMDGSSSWWRDIWFIRLGRALWSSMDGDGSDDTVYSKRPKREDLESGVRTRRGEYFRFNVEFIGREPRLDDASRIPDGTNTQMQNRVECTGCMIEN